MLRFRIAGRREHARVGAATDDLEGAHSRHVYGIEIRCEGTYADGDDDGQGVEHLLRGRFRYSRDDNDIT